MDCSVLPGSHFQKCPPCWEEAAQQLLTLLLLLPGADEGGDSVKMAGIQVHRESFLQSELWILIDDLEGM